MKRMITAAFVILIFTIAGIYERSSHSNAWEEYKQTGDSSGYVVNYVFEKERIGLFDYARSWYKSADAVVEAEVKEGSDNFCNDCMEYTLKVGKVLKGDSDLAGKEINYKVIFHGLFKGRLYPEQKEIFGKYVNFMKPGMTYMVFLHKPAFDYGEGDIYLSHEHNGFPYFLTEDVENKFDEKEYEELDRKNYYTTVEDNEFFVKDEEALNMVMEFKHEIMDIYYGGQE